MVRTFEEDPMPHIHHSRWRAAAAVVSAAAVLAVGADAISYAANGDSLLLGRTNTSNGATTVDNNGRGPALKLVTRPGAAPLAVSSGTRVKKLNADKVDGKSSKELEPKTLVYTLGTAGGAMPGSDAAAIDLAPGRYQVGYWFSAFRSSGTFANCFLYTPAAGTYDDIVSATGTTTWVGLSASGVVSISAAEDLVFSCEGDTDAILNGKIVISVRRLTSVGNGTFAARPVPRPATSVTR